MRVCIVVQLFYKKKWVVDIRYHGYLWYFSIQNRRTLITVISIYSANNRTLEQQQLIQQGHVFTIGGIAKSPS